MKQITLSTIALLAVFTFALCLPLQQTTADEVPTRGKAGDVLTPLALGNTWIYESDGDDLITTDRIEGIVLFDGQPWHLLRTYDREKGQPINKNVSVESDLWLAMIDGHECEAFTEFEPEGIELKISTPSKYYRYPVALGDKYQPNADDPAVVVVVTAVNEKVKTEAGEFECIVYQETIEGDEGYSFTSYVAPGVGIIKHISVEDGETSTSTLTSYTLVEDE